MTRAPRNQPSAAHFDRPADVAAHVAAQAAVVVMAAEAARAATYAVAIARAVAATGRGVALGDLAGGLEPIYALAGGEDAAGIADAFRDGLPLTEVARPVPEHPSLYVLPSGARVRSETALADADRWSRLVRGFGEAGGLLLLVVPEGSPLVPTLAYAGAVLLYAGPAESAPADIPLAATIGAALPPPLPRRAPGAVPAWLAVAAAAGAIVLGGGAAVAVTMVVHRPDGFVVVAPSLRAAEPGPEAATAPDTVSLVERLDAADSANAAAFAVELVATNTAADANSLLVDADRKARLPAATIAVVVVPRSAQAVARWHKVMAGAWRSAGEADSALAAWRREGVVARDRGRVVRAPVAVLLADAASAERARAVVDVWRAKGVAAYALTQADGGRRVYVGAFETVAQAVPTAALVEAAGGAPIVAYRTGRPD